MSLVPEQSEFLLQVAELIQKAAELGFVISGGELYRTPEQQALHIKNGRSKTMNSQHLKRLAVDLNFFKTTPDGKLHLTYDREDLRPLGQFWEELDPANRWGGNWSSFKDTPHFERREGRSRMAPVQVGPGPATSIAPATSAGSGSASRRGVGLVQGTVGARCRNARDDVETVQRLLNLAAGRGRCEIDEGALKPDGAFGRKTLAAIMSFQRAVHGEQEPSGQVDPVSATLSSLCEVLSGEVDIALLGLAYLRADEDDVRELCPGIQKTLANRNIDSPLRCAHFLAQIGHESGELRFREEIASGQAYEGRMDLGNTVSGDGRRFKGRGLIQLTGRANYTQYGRAIDRESELLQHPESVASEVDLCVDVAGWYWAKRGLNALADADDLTAITKRINGGLNGLEDRRRLLTRVKSLLGV
jgi:predicted chitinase/peptidoglycan hydrolase-like protein with peptidoglycan-binding domain